jgi:hypothetical protein
MRIFPIHQARRPMDPGHTALVSPNPAKDCRGRHSSTSQTVGVFGDLVVFAPPEHTNASTALHCKPRPAWPNPSGTAFLRPELISHISEFIEEMNVPISLGLARGCSVPGRHGVRHESVQAVTKFRAALKPAGEGSPTVSLMIDGVWKAQRNWVGMSLKTMGRCYAWGVVQINFARGECYIGRHPDLRRIQLSLDEGRPPKLTFRDIGPGFGQHWGKWGSSKSAGERQFSRVHYLLGAQGR